MPPVDQVTRFFVCFLKVEASSLSKTSIPHRLKQLALRAQAEQGFKVIPGCLIYCMMSKPQWMMHPSGML